VLVKSVAVTAIPHKPHKQRYTVVIANGGASSAGPFQVLFTPGDGSPSQTQIVTGIAAHSSRRLSFVGPLCTAASPPTVVADSADQVDDADRDNNAMTVTCPS
jgi:CARDB protein